MNQEPLIKNQTAPTRRRSTVHNKSDRRRSSIFADEIEHYSHRGSLTNEPIGKGIKGGAYKGENHNKIDEAMEALEEESEQRPFCQRAFSKMESGGIRASILTIVSSMIGVGFLT